MSREIIKLKRPTVRADDAKNPEAWRINGARLLKGARLIWHQQLAPCLEGYKQTRGKRTRDQDRALAEGADYFAPFFVLAGLAVENYLKARILERRIATGPSLPDAAAVLGVVTSHISSPISRNRPACHFHLALNAC